MALVYIGLGSNLGDKYNNLKNALESIVKDYNIKVIKQSSIKATKPVDYLNQPDFLNQVIILNTDIDPHNLLNILKKIEKKLGRDTTFPKGPRIIDLDILLYDDIIIQTDALTIPHPEIKNRKFILDHLVELDQNIIDPITKIKYVEVKIDELHKKHK